MYSVTMTWKPIAAPMMSSCARLAPDTLREASRRSGSSGVRGVAWRTGDAASGEGEAREQEAGRDKQRAERVGPRPQADARVGREPPPAGDPGKQPGGQVD